MSLQNTQENFRVEQNFIQFIELLRNTLFTCFHLLLLSSWWEFRMNSSMFTFYIARRGSCLVAEADATLDCPCHRWVPAVGTLQALMELSLPGLVQVCDDGCACRAR